MQNSFRTCCLTSRWPLGLILPVATEYSSGYERDAESGMQSSKIT